MDALDLPKVETLMKFFNANPPVHLMVKAYLGIETPSEPPKVVDNAAFMQMLGGVHRG